MRTFTDDKLLIATHNAGKLREFQDVLGPFVKEIVSAGQLGLPEPEETGTTFTENALLKARAASQATGFAALGDDGGLCVSGLGGKPGLYSARWAGPDKDFSTAVQRIHNELGANTDSSAYFACVLALVWPDGHVETVEGRCNGKLIREPRGTKGYDYDPWFVPDGYDQTFAELERGEKHTLSHRGKAAKALLEMYFARGGD